MVRAKEERVQDRVFGDTGSKVVMAKEEKVQERVFGDTGCRAGGGRGSWVKSDEDGLLAVTIKFPKEKKTKTVLA